VAFPNAGEAWGFVVATVLATAGGHHAVSANKSHAVRRIWAAHQSVTTLCGGMCRRSPSTSTVGCRGEESRRRTDHLHYSYQPGMDLIGGR
jgi:hypothetical protein